MPQSSRSLWFTRLAAVIAVGSATLCGTARAVDLKAMVADYERPFVYAIAAGVAPNPDTLLFINTATNAVTRRLAVGQGVTDLTVHTADGRLYISNWGQPVTRVVDLQNQQELPSLALGTDVYRINAGRPGRIYTEEEDQWVRFRGINSSSGAILSDANVREGDGAIDPTGHWYYHCDNNISNAHITRYDISTDTPVAGPISGQHPYGSRNLVLSGDGSRLFWRGYVYDAALTETGFLNEEIYATTLRGEVAFSANHAFNAATGALLATLPVSSTVHVVTGDQQKLYSYNATTHALVVTPMSSIATVPGPGLHPVPANGTTVVLPLDRLSWDVTPMGLSYRAYFGEDSAAVATAVPGSPLMLGQVTGTSIPLLAALVPEGNYYWRVDVVGFASTMPGSVWRFTVAPIQATPNRVTVDAIRGTPTARVPVVLTAEGDSRTWSVTESAPWLSLDHASGTTPDTVWLSFDTTPTPGSYPDTLRFEVDDHHFSVPVTLRLIQMAVSQMVTDPERPYIYALHPGTGLFDDAYLLFLNTETKLVDQVMPIGKNPTDLAVHVQEDRLYVTNWGQPVTRVVDLLTHTPLPPLALGTDVYKVNSGRSGRVYVEEEDQWIYMRGIDSGTGSVLSSSFVREGDGETDPTGRWYYHCDNNSSGARITRFDVQTDVPVAGPVSAVHGYGSRNLVMAADGSRLFWRGFVYDTTLVELTTLGEEIYATTPHGDLAFSSNHAINTFNGRVMATLPVASTTHAVSNDQQNLFSYDPILHAFAVTPLSAIAAVPGPAAHPLPVDGATIILPLDSLRWDVSASALRYRVYFGADSGAVAEATPDSPWLLGEPTGATLPTPPLLVLGATYFWRVDVVGFADTTAGDVWVFTVAPLVVSPSRLTLNAVMGAPPARVDLQLTDAGTSQPWTVSESSDWIDVAAPSGSSPDSVGLLVGTSTLASGTYRDTVRFEVGAYRFSVPVELKVVQMTLTQMVTDFERPYIYALHPGSTLSDDAFVLFLNTSTNQIDKAVSVGKNPTDMAVHLGEGRLYVSNWGDSTTRIVDLQTQTALPPIAVGTDVYRINAGRPGRIYTEGKSSTVPLRAIDPATSTVLGSVNVREGDAVIDPTGQWYYHCDNGLSTSRVTRFDIAGDTPVAGPVSPQHASGSRNLVMSGEGSRLFWKGYVYDRVLSELRNLGEEIYATTVQGSVALSATRAINAVTGAIITTLPIASTVQAVSGDQQKHFAYDATAHAIVVTPMSAIAPVPAPGLHPVPAHASTIVLPLDSLTWAPSPVAVSYRVYLGSDSAAVAAAAPSSPLMLGEATSPMIPLSTPLDLGATYFWRVDLVGFSNTTAGTVWRFTVAPLVTSSNLIRVRGVRGAAIAPMTIAVTAAGANRDWSVTESSAWFSVNPASGSTPDSLVLTFDAGVLAAGNYVDTLRFTSGDHAFSVPVAFQLIQMSVTQMVSDPQRPYIYALQPGSGLTDDAFLLFVNTQTNLIDKALPIGRSPTDMDVHAAEGRLYVTNWGQPVTRVVDLQTRNELPPLALGTDVYRINAGREGRILVEGKAGSIPLRVIHSTTGQVLSSLTVREGDGAFDPTGHWYYHCDNGVLTARVTRYDVDSDVPVPGPISPIHSDGSRNVVIAGDGSRVFWRGYVYDAELNETRNLGEEVYATTLHGEIAFTSWRALNTVNGVPLSSLAFTTTVRALSGDQQKLFSYNPNTNAIVMAPMTVVVPSPSPATIPVPAHGATIVLPLDTLRWTLSSTALRYQVYLGTDSAAVAGAALDSPLMIVDGTTTLAALPEPLALGGRYYWRVDVAGYTGTTIGSVWQFTVAPMVVGPSRVTLLSMKGAPIARVPLVLTAGIGAQDWSLSESATWLDVQPRSGATGVVPDTLWLTFDTSALNPATYRDTIKFVGGVYRFGVPIELKIIQTTVTQMVTDFERPFVYALHPGLNATDDSYLLILSTQTEKIVQLLPLGKGATDMTVHSAEGRLYVSNWGQPVTRVVDLDTQSELPSLALGTDVYRINFGRAGRVYTEGKSGTVSLRGIHTGDGAVLNTSSVREGDAAVEPLGKWYYHCDNGTTTARITRFDVRTDTPVAGPQSPIHSTGSRNLVMSDDGSRIFWKGYVYDEALVEINNLAAEVVAASRYGNVAYTSTQAIRVWDRTVLGTLVTSTVRAISGDQAKLFTFNPSTHAFVVSPSYVSPIVAVEGPTVPVSFALHGVYPNPVVSSGRLTIRFALRTSDDATLEIVDIQGRCVWRHELRTPTPGFFSLPVEPSVRFGSGVYFLTLQQAGQRATKRLVVTR